MEIYLDNNATTKPLPQVTEIMMEVLGENYGNPSSSHSVGERVRCYLHDAHESFSQLIGVDPDKVIFTSSGTEANNMALSCILKWRAGKAHIITTQVEHSSVLKYCEYLSSLGYEVDYLPVDKKGLINLETLRAKIKPETKLVSVQWVNNETGVIQPIEAISEICKEKLILLHTDGAQALGKIDIKQIINDIDFFTCTAHKIHGPQGVGAISAKNLKMLGRLLHGGGQGHGYRPGTENLSGIVGFGKAAEIRNNNFNSVVDRHRKLRDDFERLLFDGIQDIDINGDIKSRVCNTTNIYFHGVDGQALMARLDQLGVYCSQSSACTNMTPEPSYVLRAMGMTNDEAYSSLRFSFSELNSRQEVERAVACLSEAVKKIREFCGYKIKQSAVLSEAI